MSKRYDGLIGLALLGSAVGYGAWWSYTELPGRYMDTEEAIEAYYAGEFRGAYNAFARLAEEGDARAQLGLAELYWHSKVPEKDPGAAPYWYSQAADQGNATAAYLLAVYVGNYPDNPDNQRIHRLQDAAKVSHPIAVVRLGLAYIEGRYGVETDLELGRQTLASAARDGNGYAAYSLARAYAFGPLGSDLDLALDWYFAAVQAGHAPALDDLVILRTARDSTVWDPEDAYRWKLVQISWQAQSERGLPVPWFPPIDFLVFDEASPIATSALDTQPGPFESGPHAEALGAIDSRMRAFAEGRYHDLGPAPEVKGLFLNLSGEAILRAESKALMFLRGHPSPPTEWRVFD